MTEIEKVKSEIQELQEKLQKLEEQDPEMLLLRQGKVDFVDYDRKKYIRIEYTDSFADGYNWYVRRVGEDAIRPVRDVNVYASLEELYQKEVVKQKDDYPYKIADEPEEQKWDVVRESLKWHKEHPNESVEDYLTPKTPEKRKIDDLAEKLLPDDHPYKITDEHGELNPYKQYLNSVEDEKKMEELGFVKNSDGSWTAQPLGETAQEEVKKLQEKDWEIKVETDYRTGKARHKTRIVDKDGNDYKPEAITTEELLKHHWEPKPQNEEEVTEGLRSAIRKAKEDGVFDTPKESWMDKPIDELVDKLMENPPDCLKFQLGKTLEQIVYWWWCDTFTGPHEKWNMEECIDDLIDQVELWFPREQSSEGSQDIYAVVAVEAHNDLLKKIKSKLRTPHKRGT